MRLSRTDDAPAPAATTTPAPSITTSNAAEVTCKRRLRAVEPIAISPVRGGFEKRSHAPPEPPADNAPPQNFGGGCGGSERPPAKTSVLRREPALRADGR